jgi:hypothetical protein
MTKKWGSKKGKKWPKMGVQKRVKNDPKIAFSGQQKKIRNNKRHDATQ